MILYGPPGSGKTTLARIAATRAGAAFEEASAVNAGRAEVRAVIERARERRRALGHRHDLLPRRDPSLQQGAAGRAAAGGRGRARWSLIGATTENPYFEVNSALLSRSQIYELRPLAAEQVAELLRRALSDAERGIPDPPEVPDEAIEFLAARSGGDARAAYNALELASDTAQRLGQPVTVELAEDAMQKKAVLYDKGGDKHYDYISAWIKATRGSDVDASLYYLAVMLEGGEDPRFIARRMIVLASEDIGNADPQALRGRRRGGAGRGARRHAGVRPQPQPGGGLPGAGSEVERQHAPRSPVPAPTCGARAPPIPLLPSGRALSRREGTGPRSRLRVPAQPARRSVGPDAAARGNGGAAATTSRTERGFEAQAAGAAAAIGRKQRKSGD